MPTLDTASPLTPFLASIPDLPGLDNLFEQVLLENSHAIRDELKVLRTEVFESPFEEGANIGEIELELNLEGNRAIYGIYNVKPHFQCFMN
jgi:hypothetical protein